VISLHDVRVEAEGGIPLLVDVTVDIDADRTAVIGANGSGKTTLARLLNGLALPSAGDVTVDGLDVVRDRAAVQRRVGFVFANADHQLVYPTPLEDVMLGLRARGVRRAEARERALEALRTVGIAHKADQAIHTLSGGEKHLAALAAVLALEPGWLVVDEPTTTLDIVNRRRVIDVLLGLEQRLVVVSHDLDLVRGLDEALLVHDARVIGRGTPDDMVDRYLGLVTA